MGLKRTLKIIEGTLEMLCSIYLIGGLFLGVPLNGTLASIAIIVCLGTTFIEGLFKLICVCRRCRGREIS